MQAFYLPGLAPIEYQKEDAVDLKVPCGGSRHEIGRGEVNKLTSAKTQLPYSYYHLAFCTSGASGSFFSPSIEA